MQRPLEVPANVGNILPNTGLAEVVAIAGADSVTLLKKKNCRVSVSIGLRFSYMHLLTLVPDTGAGLNITRSDILEPSSENQIRRREVPDLYSANNPRLRLSTTIMIHLKVSEAGTQVVFGVVENDQHQWCLVQLLSADGSILSFQGTGTLSHIPLLRYPFQCFTTLRSITETNRLNKEHIRSMDSIRSWRCQHQNCQRILSKITL